MTNRIILLAAIGLTLCGCASPLRLIDFYEADAEALRNYSQIVILEDEIIDGGYRDLGEVEGLYCNRTQAFEVDSSEAIRSAVDQVKLRAGASGADAITMPRCEERTTWDLTNNCFATVTCRSQALVSVSN